jgi:predicted kinase
LAEVAVYLVSGGTGAGKTTYARALADRVGAVCFSIDDWMTTLFWMDSPQPIAFDWTMARIERCEAMIQAQVRLLFERSVPSVLDLGFTRADHRSRFAAFARAIGAGVELHVVDVPPDVRWARVQARNSERGETYAMQVERTMFDFMESEWQAPDEAEMHALDGHVA